MLPYIQPYDIFDERTCPSAYNSIHEHNCKCKCLTDNSLEMSINKDLLFRDIRKFKNLNFEWIEKRIFKNIKKYKNIKQTTSKTKMPLNQNLTPIPERSPPKPKKVKTEEEKQQAKIKKVRLSKLALIIIAVASHGYQAGKFDDDKAFDDIFNHPVLDWRKLYKLDVEKLTDWVNKEVKRIVKTCMKSKEVKLTIARMLAPQDVPMLEQM